MSLPVTTRCLRWWGHQHWIPRGLRYRVLRQLANPDRTAATFQCAFAGLRYGGTLASYIDWNVYFLGAYEPEVLAFLADAADLAGKEAVFVDIGANVGQHSLFMAPRCARVVAFEPWDKARTALNANIALNRLDNVDVRPVALGDETGELQFYAPDSANLGTGSFVADVNVNVAAGRLPVMRGDEALADAERIDVVKIDTEGFETKVLAGLKHILARHRPVVLFELTPPVAASLGGSGSLEQGLMNLLGPGWRLRCLQAQGERYRLTPFSFDGIGQAIAVALPDESPLS